MENTHENTWKEKELFKHRSEFPRFYRAGGGDLSKFNLYTVYCIHITYVNETTGDFLFDFLAQMFSE